MLEFSTCRDDLNQNFAINIFLMFEGYRKIKRINCAKSIISSIIDWQGE